MWDEELLLLYLHRKRILRRQRNRQSRRWWVCPINSRRLHFGFWDTLIREMEIDEPQKFTNFHRLDVSQFQRLLAVVEQDITKNSPFREVLDAGLRLSLTLRYLASGDSMVSIAYQYRVGRSTVSGVIRETCAAIYEKLLPQHMKNPDSADWERNAREFYEMWNFPNCCGSIDGKHCQVQKFNNSGSRFFNCKKTFSLVLMAVCDAHCRFTVVSVGSSGRESDAVIFGEMEFGKQLVKNEIPLPPARHFDGFQVPLPAVFIGDPAFPLRPNLMKPYSGDAGSLTDAQTIANYRFSRARRTSENAFGIAASRFRILRKPIIAAEETANEIIKAILVLHNMLRTEAIEAPSEHGHYTPPGFLDTENDGQLVEGAWREHQAGFRDLLPTTHRNPSVLGKEVRANFADYFTTNGEVPWQWKLLS